MIRKFLLWLHLVAGLAAAGILISLGLTGAVMVFEVPLDHALNARLYRVHAHGAALRLNDLLAKVEQASPGAHVSDLALPRDEDLAVVARLRSAAGKPVAFTVDPYTGQIIGPLSTANSFTQKVHLFHKNLLLGPAGKTITLWAALLLILLALTGVVLWWPRKIWTIGSWKPGRRANFDLHNVLGFWSSIFLLFFGVTGVIIHWDEEAARLIAQWTHTPVQGDTAAVQPMPGVKARTVEQLAEAARRVVPGATIVSISGLGNGHAPVRVSMRFPEDYTPGGRSVVQLDPATGAVLSLQTSRNAPPGYRVAKYWNRQLHTGDTFGWPSRIVASLASLSLPLLALTGPLIWWGKFKRRRSGDSLEDVAPLSGE